MHQQHKGQFVETTFPHHHTVVRTRPVLQRRHWPHHFFRGWFYVSACKDEDIATLFPSCVRHFSLVTTSRNQLPTDHKQPRNQNEWQLLISMCFETNIITCGLIHQSNITFKMLTIVNVKKASDALTHCICSCHISDRNSNRFHDEAAFPRIFKVSDKMLLFKREHAHDLIWLSLLCLAQSDFSHGASFLLGLVLGVLLRGPATSRSARHQLRLVVCFCASTFLLLHLSVCACPNAV